jgi:hypothetical protein
LYAFEKTDIYHGKLGRVDENYLINSPRIPFRQTKFGKRAAVKLKANRTKTFKPVQ